jgi:hypothetical protein
MPSSGWVGRSITANRASQADDAGAIPLLFPGRQSQKGSLRPGDTGPRSEIHEPLRVDAM